MRRALPFVFLFAIAFSFCVITNAQNDRFAYAITDLTKEGSGWNALRKLDLKTGEYSDILLNGADAKTAVYHAVSRKIMVQQADARFGTLLQAPFSTGVAAAAYDRKNNRLYFTPMFIDQLRYIDLKTMKVYYVADEAFTKFGDMHNDQAKCITRMVIAPDGNGYAISNDGNTVIKFSTGKKTTIQQLGSLIDDPANKTTSIHNSCTSYGGDMIADDKGNLYIMSARNQVFKVNIETKVATYLGGIKGLPANFTVNGAVVDGEGNLLVSSAIDGNAYYVVNPKSWEASVYGTKAVYRSSDLANSNYLSTVSNRFTTIETIMAKTSALSKLIQVYPNPLTNDYFTLQFNKVPVGDYIVELTDVMGRSIMQKRITVNHEYGSENISLSSTNAKGVYLVKVADKNKKAQFEQKVLIQ
ncbi:MAG: T9SS type A sorting domain-containing protein [Chitinophagaceae bacterium]